MCKVNKPLVPFNNDVLMALVCAGGAVETEIASEDVTSPTPLDEEVSTVRVLCNNLLSNTIQLSIITEMSYGNQYKIYN